MSVKLTTSLSQRLVLTPQLRQRIEMLQMTSIELSELIQQQLLENPVLEEVVAQEEKREIEEHIIDQLAGGNTDLANATAALQPGQYARALIRPVSQAGTGAGFVVPEEAVQDVEGRSVVFVRTEHGFLATPVTVGQRGGGRAEIVGGLQPGQIIAGRKAFVLKAELGKGDAGHDH